MEDAQSHCEAQPLVLVLIMTAAKQRRGYMGHGYNGISE
jgi:hypothetical protein